MSTETMPQHLRALRIGEAVRIESARIRREVATLGRRQGLERVAELLEDPPEAIQRTRVELLVRSVRTVGPGQAAILLCRVGANPTRCVGPIAAANRRTLSERQRRALAAELREEAERGAVRAAAASA